MMVKLFVHLHVKSIHPLFARTQLYLHVKSIHPWQREELGPDKSV